MGAEALPHTDITLPLAVLFILGAPASCALDCHFGPSDAAGASISGIPPVCMGRENPGTGHTNPAFACRKR